MIFIDSNVFIYAVGRAHPLRNDAQSFFIKSAQKGKRLITSAEVLQELLHVYLPVMRLTTLNAALMLATMGVDEVMPIDRETVLYARNLIGKHPALTARDLLHLAVCRKHDIKEIKTYDRALSAVFKKA